MKKERTKKKLIRPGIGLGVLVLLSLAVYFFVPGIKNMSWSTGIPELLDPKTTLESTAPRQTETSQQAYPTGTAEPSHPSTDAPTATILPSSTPVPALEELRRLAREQEMLVVILFTPAIWVDPYYDQVWEVEGYTPEELVGASYPEAWESIQSESYYKDHYRVILVGEFNGCWGTLCDDPPVYEFGYINGYGGQGGWLLTNPPPEGAEESIREIEYGGVVVHWHIDETDFCVVGTFLSFWCTNMRP